MLLHLARKAFYPARPPFPLLHIDTTWKFRAMIAFRDATVRRFGLELRTHTNPEGLRQGINPFDHGGAYTQIMKTDALKQALTEGGYDLAIGGARRDEERSRAKERIFSVRGPGPCLGPEAATAGALAPLQRQPRAGGNTAGVSAVELDGAGRVDLHRGRTDRRRAAVFRGDAADRRGATASSSWWTTTGCDLNPDEAPVDRMVRFRSLGCYPLSAAVESEAADLDDVAGRNAPDPGLRTRRTPDRSRRRTPRWSARSGKAISDASLFDA